MIIKKIFGASLLGALMITGLSAQASTTVFLYDGVVTNCPDTGMTVCGDSLFVGDGVGGTLEVNSAAIVPGGQVGSGDIAGYDFGFGPDIVFNSANSVITQSFIQVDGAGELDGGALVISAMMAVPGTSDQILTLNFGASFWTIVATIGTEDILVASGAGKLTEIPVPGALLMFGPALLGFLGLRRKAA